VARGVRGDKLVYVRCVRKAGQVDLGCHSFGRGPESFGYWSYHSLLCGESFTLDLALRLMIFLWVDSRLTFSVISILRKSNSSRSFPNTSNSSTLIDTAGLNRDIV
jgi:hypothetical protein